jgi:hypothetical protein
MGDGALIKQAVSNILLNAIKFAKLREEAIIGAGGYTKEKESIHFIKDNGVGFVMAYSSRFMKPMNTRAQGAIWRSPSALSPAMVAESGRKASCFSQLADGLYSKLFSLPAGSVRSQTDTTTFYYTQLMSGAEVSWPSCGRKSVIMPCRGKDKVNTLGHCDLTELRGRIAALSYAIVRYTGFPGKNGQSLDRLFGRAGVLAVNTALDDGAETDACVRLFREIQSISRGDLGVYMFIEK